MKIQAQIEALENLANLDAEIAALEEELGQGREALGGKKSELDELEAKVAASRASIEEMDRTRGELVQEARQMSVQMERSREKLARCRTEREVNAAQREIEELRKLYRDREQEVEKLAGLAEQARAEMGDVEKRRDGIAEDLGESEGAVASKLRELEGAAGLKQKAREQLVAAVTPQLYRRYEMIRRRLGSAVAHVSDGTCSACHMRIMPMMFQQMQRGDDFEQCPSCRRIIYFRAPSADSADAESTGA